MRRYWDASGLVKALHDESVRLKVTKESAVTRDGQAYSCGARSNGSVTGGGSVNPLRRVFGGDRRARDERAFLFSGLRLMRPRDNKAVCS